jgi:6-phosphofructokinase 1
MAEKVKTALPDFDTRVSILGHMQRGGAPTCMERVNASRIGYASVEALIQGKKSVMVGIVDKKTTYTPFEQALKHVDSLDADFIKMMEILAL